MMSTLCLVDKTFSDNYATCGVVLTILALYLSVSYWTMRRAAKRENSPSGWITVAATVSAVALLTTVVSSLLYWTSALDWRWSLLAHGASAIFSSTAMRIHPSGVVYLWVAAKHRRTGERGASVLGRGSSPAFDWGMTFLIAMFLAATFQFALGVL